MLLKSGIFMMKLDFFYFCSFIYVVFKLKRNKFYYLVFLFNIYFKVIKKIIILIWWKNLINLVYYI